VVAQQQQKDKQEAVLQAVALLQGPLQVALLLPSSGALYLLSRPYAFCQ
jgi:hypothetical protein